MNIEIVDGSKVYSNILAEPTVEGASWNALIRSDNSVSLYLTTPRLYGHAVLFDSLDSQPPNETALRVLNELLELRKVIDVLEMFMKVSANA